MPRETLKEYLSGWTTPELSASIETHVQSCDVCERTVAELDGDPDTLVELIGQVAKKSAPGEITAPSDFIKIAAPERQSNRLDGIVESAISRAKRLPNESPKIGPSSPGVKELGPYDLLRPLGRGGMGAVYLARHRQLGKQVAIKILPQRSFRDQHYAARFQREIRASGTLNHPTIVSATDAGEFDSTHYLVMEYIDGLDASCIARAMGQLAIADACAIGHSVAIGLAHAHATGIVHRDIKPSNLIVSKTGQVKVLDFGLAQVGLWDEATAELTTVGQLMGTLDCMAPEQAERADLVDYRADLYSLGATLFRLVGGRAPLAAAPNLSPLAKLRMLAVHVAPSLDTLRSDAPKEFVELVRSLLARDPAARPPSAAHVAEMLVSLAADANLPALVAAAIQKQELAPEGSEFPFDDDPRVEDRSVALVQPQIKQLSSQNRKTSQRWRWLTAAVLFPTAIILGLLVTLETQKGQLVIESVDANIQVSLAQNGQVVDTLKIVPGTSTTRLYAGKYEVRIDTGSDRFTLDHNTFEIEKGETLVARVTNKIVSAAATNSSQSGPIESTTPPSPLVELQPGWALEMRSITDLDLRAKFKVSSDYSVKVPLIGIVSAKGDSLQSLEAKLNELYKPKITNPAVEINFDYGATFSIVTTQPLMSEPKHAPAAQPVVQNPNARPSHAEEPVYQGKTFAAWMDVVVRERDEISLNAAMDALFALASPKLEPGTAEKLLAACRSQSDGFDHSLFGIVARTQSNPSAYFRLINKTFDTADDAWAKRILKAAPFGIEVNQGQDAGVDLLIDWLQTNVFPSQSKTTLLKSAADYFDGELRSQRLPEKTLSRMVKILQEEQRLGNEFWLAGPGSMFLIQGSTWYPAYTQIKQDKAISVLLNDASPSIDTAHAALMLGWLRSKEYDAHGVKPIESTNEIAGAVARRLNSLLAQPDTLTKLLDVDGRFSRNTIPELAPSLPLLRLEFSFSNSVDNTSIPCSLVVELLDLAENIGIASKIQDQVQTIIDRTSSGAFSAAKRWAVGPYSTVRESSVFAASTSLMDDPSDSLRQQRKNVNWTTQALESRRGVPTKLGDDEISYLIYNRAIACVSSAERPKLIEKQTELYKLRWCELSINNSDENRDGRWTIEEAGRDLKEPEKADQDQNGAITAAELLQYLNNNVLNQTRTSGPPSALLPSRWRFYVMKRLADEDRENKKRKDKKSCNT